MQAISTELAPGAFWGEIIRRDNPQLFAAAFVDKPYLEGSSFTGRMLGTEKLRLFFNVTRTIYELIAFTRETAGPNRLYMEWEGLAFGGMTVSGMTTLTFDVNARIEAVYLYHRPFEAVSRFSAELEKHFPGVKSAVFPEDGL